MVNDVNIFETRNAQLALTNSPSADYDHGFVFENLSIQFTNATTTHIGAGLVLYRPGECNTIRNVGIQGGAYGILCYGVGAPGLHLEFVSISGTAIANVSVEKYVNGNAISSGNGPITLIGLSGDNGRSDCESTNCFLRINQVEAVVSLSDFKAEGQYGGGLVQYNSCSTNPTERVGSLAIRGGEYDCYTNGNNPVVPCDLVVLGKVASNIAIAPSVRIEDVNLWNVRHLIMDDVTGRTIEPETGGGMQAACRLPVNYEAYSSGGPNPPPSRLVIGGDALAYLVPPAVGWYRVMTSIGSWPLGGRLAINSLYDSSELSVGVVPGTTDATPITVAQTTLAAAEPNATFARAGSYWDPNLNGTNSGGSVGFLDLYLTNLHGSDPYNQRITFAHPIQGRMSVGSGAQELLWPTNTFPSANYWPSWCSSGFCVTNSLTR
jgi:hypothetical protein